MPVVDNELPKKKKPKSNWMRLFVISPPLTDLEKAQLESRRKVTDAFKKRINKR